MGELTIGYVSGIIAAGIFIIQRFIPTATSLILSGLLRDENTAATWTQVARALHSTYWPTFVRADTVTSGPVSRVVQFEALMRPLVLGVVAIAAIVTPLGLYDAIVPDHATSLEPFQYSKDQSPFGFGTPPRSDLGFNRFCGKIGRTTCPGSDVVIENRRNGTQYLPYGYDARIPPKVMETFQSGLKSLSPTVSSIFDIEWRSYGIRSEDIVNNGSKFLVGEYRQAGVLALNNAYDKVEGLIVDTKNGGIGFRNHTTPSPLPHGSEWSEDLLFVEPHTVCIDTNLTMDFRIGLSGPSTIEDLVLTDRGGFVNLNTTYPEYDRLNSQADPDFYGRAYKAAFLNNALTMIYLNVSNPRTKDLEPFSYMNSAINKTFTLEGNIGAKADRFLTDQNWGSYLSLKVAGFNSTFNSTGSGDDYPNPFDITTSNFTSIEVLCQGAGGLDYANITNIGVVCGMAFGAARRSDGSRSLVFEPGSTWTVPMYSCASAARAVIKTVDFRFNGTDGLNSLAIRSIRDKTYARDTDKPLWGVERSEEILDEVLPLWGLVSDQNKGRDDLSVLQKEYLWLPGYAGRFGTSPVGYSNLPGMYFHTGGFQTAYDISTSPPSGVSDYSGATNLAMYSKWQELSEKANTTARIINLVWTDVAANAVVGTKGWFSQDRKSIVKRGDQSSTRPEDNNLREVPVVIFRRVVKYNLKFAIPAILALVFTVVIASATCLLCVFGRARPSRMRKYLFYTSAGRIMASFVYPNQADPQGPSKQWNSSVGFKRIAVDGPVPRAKDPVMMSKFGDANTTNMDAPLLKDGSMGAGFRPPSTGFTAPNQPQQY
ncbi:hypothetical protein I7I53_00732 [Histoplasma capsulatum var. duboisii H88]|uniref:Uncharacterized protein n=1 Tax=Ajellomyces capsulatus (strain H88) TaxID=544711 RepID=A0A8A1LN84_AJEC8|nr:hypothetical protein I7I53_00732 [Histoplasma capsulatum var. duboisii H88]